MVMAIRSSPRRRNVPLLLFALTLCCSLMTLQASLALGFHGRSVQRIAPRCMMSSQTLQSTKSTTVKKIHSLLSKRKQRQDLGLTVVEGPRMVLDLLQNVETRPLVQQVLVSSERNDLFEELQSKHPSLFIQLGTPEVLKACSDTVTPQGIVAIVSIPEFQLRKKAFPFYLVLDGVSDPGNVGTLLRSSVAVGASGVVLLQNCCDVWNPKAVRSAMGCTFQVPVLAVDSYLEFQSLLQVETMYAATMAEGASGQSSVPYFDVDWTTSPSALIVGSEGSGLSDSVRKAVAAGAIQATHVPMEAGIESLNAAVCGSIIMFEFLRQCRLRSSCQE